MISGQRAPALAWLARSNLVQRYFGYASYACWRWRCKHWLLFLRYITVVNKLTGKSDMVKGPCIWFPGPYVTALELSSASVQSRELIGAWWGSCCDPATEDNVSAVKDAIVLQDDEYVPSRTCRFFLFRFQYDFSMCFCVSRPLRTGETLRWSWKTYPLEHVGCIAVGAYYF